jgi:hypothetical protein
MCSSNTFNFLAPPFIGYFCGVAFALLVIFLIIGACLSCCEKDNSTVEVGDPDSEMEATNVNLTTYEEVVDQERKEAVERL